ncbi:DUF3349 domain-containing protein, partial [Mycolicibacterium sp. CBMA 361]
PEGVPATDRVPLLALLARRLTNDEVKAVARVLVDRGEFDHIDIGVVITRITDELPRDEDVERVRERLAAKGWPLDDPRDPSDGPDSSDGSDGPDGPDSSDGSDGSDGPDGSDGNPDDGGVA